MPCLRVISVDSAFIDVLWDKVCRSGSYYSIGDGASKQSFHRVLFESVFVVEGDDFVIRAEMHPDCIELHPIVFGHSFFKNAPVILAEAILLIDRLFAKMPICCIIPEGMRGAKRLAEIAGLVFERFVDRSLSGVVVRCSVFVKRRI